MSRPMHGNNRKLRKKSMPCMALVWSKRGKTRNSVFCHCCINFWQR